MPLNIWRLTRPADKLPITEPCFPVDEHAAEMLRNNDSEPINSNDDNRVNFVLLRDVIK